MNRAERKAVERVVRAAIDDTATEVGPGDLTPLHLVPRAGTSGQAALRAVRTRRTVSQPVAAIGAAVTVLAVAAASFGAASALRADRAEVTGPKPAAGPLSRIPRYFVELTRPPAGALRLAARALVVDSITGNVVASVTVPRPFNTFAGVTAAADDRTFVLGAQTSANPGKLGKFPPVKSALLLLRIKPRTSGQVTATMRRLGLRIPVNWVGAGLALSPDGTKLAFAAEPFTKIVSSRIWVVSLITGAARTWQDRGGIGRSPWDVRSLSWSPDDKTLAYPWVVRFHEQVNLLNTWSAGGSLVAHSRKLLGWTSREAPTWDNDLTPDGTKVIASIAGKTGAQFNEYSATTGRLVASQRPAVLSKLGVFDVLWTNNSGTDMIIELGAPPRGVIPIRLLHGNKLIKIKGIRFRLNPGDVAW